MFQTAVQVPLWTAVGHMTRLITLKILIAVFRVCIRNVGGRLLELGQLIEINHSAKDLLNVPLVDFDDLRLVCGEDQATGSYGKSFGDIPSESVNVVDDTSETPGMSVGTQSNRGRAKRSRPWEEAFSRIDGLAE